MRWKVGRSVRVYDGRPWLSVWKTDVEMPDGTRVEGHHVVEFGADAVAAVPIGPDGRILLVQHHRFTTDSVGWECVCGRVERDESPIEAARRELLEEVGGRAAEIVPLGRYFPASGSCRLEFHAVEARGVVLDGAPTGPRETGPTAWFPPAEVERLIDEGRISQGLSLTALLLHLRRSNP